MIEITELPWCRHGINKSGYCADCKVESLITTIEQQRLDIVDKDEHIRALRIAKEHEIECHAKTCFEHQDQIIAKDALIESQEEQISAFKLGTKSGYEIMEMQRLKLESQNEEIQALSQGYYRKVDAVGLTLFQIKDRTIESLQKENEQLRHRDRVVSLTNETLGRYVREGKEEIARLKLTPMQKMSESMDSLSHIQEGIKPSEGVIGKPGVHGAYVTGFIQEGE